MKQLLIISKAHPSFQSGQKFSFCIFGFRITSFCKVHTQFKVTTTAQYLENWVIAYLLPNWSVVVAVWTVCAKSQTHGRLCFETFSHVPSYLCPPFHSLWWPTCSLQRERHLKVSSSWLGRKKIGCWADKHFCWLVLLVSSIVYWKHKREMVVEVLICS